VDGRVSSVDYVISDAGLTAPLTADTHELTDRTRTIHRVSAIDSLAQ